jgi:GNAT superfamily N-acetyltransferase
MFQIVEGNLRTALQFFGRASGRGCIVERDGLLLIDSGVNYAVFNIAMFTEPITTTAELDFRVSIASEWYRARHTRWSLWMCDDLLAPSVKSRAADVLHRVRLHPLTEAPGMLAERLHPLSRYLPPMEYRLVDDAQTRLDFAHLTTINFDIPFATSRAIYESPDAWSGDYVGYVGYLNRRAICTVALVIACDAIGVYSVSTLPEFRRHGYAEAFMRQVLQDAAKATGIERTVLQATRAGHEMYRRLGYRDVTRFYVYIL